MYKGWDDPTLQYHLRKAQEDHGASHAVCFIAHQSYHESAFEPDIPAAVSLVLALMALVLRYLTGARVRGREAVSPFVGLSTPLLVTDHWTVGSHSADPGCGGDLRSYPQRR